MTRPIGFAGNPISLYAERYSGGVSMEPQNPFSFQAAVKQVSFPPSRVEEVPANLPMPHEPDGNEVDEDSEITLSPVAAKPSFDFAALSSSELTERLRQTIAPMRAADARACIAILCKPLP